MNGIGITTRFIATLVGVVLFAGVAAVGLWAHDHADRRSAALAAHAGLVLQDLSDAVEARLGLGLPLAQLPEMDRLLDSARQQVPTAHGLAVADDKGRAVFSTDPVEVGDHILALIPGQEITDGHRVKADEELFWHPLTTEYGTFAGAVVLRLSAGSVTGETLAFALSLALRLALPLAGLLVLAVVAGVLIAGRAVRPALATALTLENLARHPDQSGGNTEEAAGQDAVAAFVVSVKQRHAKLAAAEAELGRLDELA
jgi:hypothetical protein